jgi:hypothetical protein
MEKLVINRIREHLPILGCRLSKQSLPVLEIWDTRSIDHNPQAVTIPGICAYAQ